MYVPLEFSHSYFVFMPNVKLSHPERASELLKNDQLPVAGTSTLGAKRIRVGCSALLGRILRSPIRVIETLKCIVVFEWKGFAKC